MKITQSMNRNALLIAATSFGIGTSLFATYFITGWKHLIVIGTYYVLIAFTLNVITFIGLLVNSIITTHLYKENMITMLFLLANLPIALVYTLLVINNPLHSVHF